MARRYLLPLYLVIFCGFFGYALQITVFTPALMHPEGALLPATAKLGRRTLLLGILLTLYPAGQFLGSPVTGALSDRVGRKRVLVATLALTALFYFVMAVALQIANLWLLGVGLLLAGLAESNIVTAQGAIADRAAVAERTPLFGYIYLSASLAYIAGPLLGGKLAVLGDAIPFWLTGGLLIVSMLLVIYGFRETRSEGGSERSLLQSLLNMKEIITNRPLRFYFWTNFLLYLALFGFFRAYPIYIVDAFGLGVSRASEYIAWTAVPIVLANLGLTGLLAKRLQPMPLAMLSAVLTGLFLILIVLPREEIWLWLTLFLGGLAVAFCLPACASVISQRVTGSQQGAAMGNNQSLQVAAEAISSFLSGLLAALLTSLPLIVWGICALIGAAILYQHCRKATI
jgi:MFS family permease